MHREFPVGLVAVGNQVVFTQTRELVHITIECLEVLSAPCAADAADMVASWEKYKSVESYITTDWRQCKTLFICTVWSPGKCLIEFKTAAVLPSLDCTSMTPAKEKARKHNHTHFHLIVATVSLQSPKQVIVKRALSSPLYEDCTFFSHTLPPTGNWSFIAKTWQTCAEWMPDAFLKSHRMSTPFFLSLNWTNMFALQVIIFIPRRVGTNKTSFLVFSLWNIHKSKATLG